MEKILAAIIVGLLVIVLLYCILYYLYKYRKWLYAIAYLFAGAGLINSIYRENADDKKLYLTLLIFLIVVTVILEIVFKLIRDKVVKSKSDYDYYTGEEFEHYVAALMRANGFSHVKVTPFSGDYGVDILAEKNFKKYAIQCKRYSSNVGNKAVQEAYSGKSFYDADIAVVVTNNYFTSHAKTTARKLEVELWDRRVIEQMRQ